MPDTTLSLLNIFDLPQSQQEIILYLTRKGPATAAVLAEALKLPEDEIKQALEALTGTGKIRINASGVAEIILGQTRRRALPTALLPVLLATDRLYTAQEIAALRTAVPILQFARAKMGEFSDHGPSHALRVKSTVTQISYALNLTTAERHLLRAAALFHDVGNAGDRVRHHLISEEAVRKLTEAGELPFSEKEAEIVGLLCRWHRGDYEPNKVDSLREETIHVGKLASVLRIADRMDIDSRRYDYTEQFVKVIKFFYPHEMPYWTSLEDVHGVRIACDKTLTMQVFTKPNVTDNFQINTLRDAIKASPLSIQLEVIPVKEADPPKREITGDEPLALIAFPFDPHSLIMAAITRKHLQQAGKLVRMICYADSANGSQWLWNETLPKLTASSHETLVIIGDRPNAATAAAALKTIETWRAAKVNVHLLNRHEANWRRLPDLAKFDVQSVLGGDWCYFWGKDVTSAEMQWGRIAALISRDPTQTTTGLSAEEESIARGFLKAVHDATGQLADDQMNWSAQADPLIKRIMANDWDSFQRQAADFASIYDTIKPSRVEGDVLIYEGLPAGVSAQVAYWALEAEIEKRGRKAERGIRFNIPYAIINWQDGESVEIMAINHWREEEAIPIRFLYPAENADMPEGHEGAIRVHVSPERAVAIVTTLINACNNKHLQAN